MRGGMVNSNPVDDETKLDRAAAHQVLRRLTHMLRPYRRQVILATVLLVLHELGPLEPLIDRAVVLRDGCVLHDGPPTPAVGQHALPGHDHVHPHAPAGVEPIRTGLLS